VDIIIKGERFYCFCYYDVNVNVIDIDIDIIWLLHYYIGCCNGDGYDAESKTCKSETRGYITVTT